MPRVKDKVRLSAGRDLKVAGSLNMPGAPQTLGPLVPTVLQTKYYYLCFRGGKNKALETKDLLCDYHLQ